MKFVRKEHPGPICEDHYIEPMAHEAMLGEVATVKETSVGPDLYIGKLKIRSWFGTKYNKEAHLLCKQINAELKVMSNLA